MTRSVRIVHKQLVVYEIKYTPQSHTATDRVIRSPDTLFTTTNKARRVRILFVEGYVRIYANVLGYVKKNRIRWKCNTVVQLIQ